MTVERHLHALGPHRTATSDSGDREWVVHVQLLADLPALGHVTYAIRGEAADNPDPPATVGTVRASVDQLENDLVRVRLLPDATFELHDKRTGRT